MTRTLRTNSDHQIGTPKEAMTENKKNSPMAIQSQLNGLIDPATLTTPKVSIHTVRDSKPSWDVSDFHHFAERKCTESSRVCIKCFSLKKLMRFGRKCGAEKKACRVYFQLLSKMSSAKQSIAFTMAIVQYKSLTNVERSYFKEMYREYKKYVDVQVIGLWNNVQKTDKVVNHKNVQRLCQVERMCRDFENLEAQGMAFEHHDGAGNCENHFTLCKYCISPFRMKIIMREAFHIKSLAGFIANILITDAYLFSVGMLDDLCADKDIRIWLSHHLPRYEDQFAPELLEYVKMRVYPKLENVQVRVFPRLEAQMLRSIVSQVTAGAFDNLPPINVAPIRIEVPALDRASAMMNDALTKIQGVLPARSVGLVTLLAELCSSSPLSSKIRCVVIYMTSFDCTGLLLNIVGSQFAKSLAQVFEGMCNQIRRGGGEQEELVAHGAPPFDESAFIGTIKLLLAMVPGIGTFEVTEQTQRVKKLEMIAKMVTSWDKLYQFAEKFMSMAYEAACEYMYGVTGMSGEMAQAERDIQEWANQVIEYYNNGGLHKVANSVGDAEMVSGWKKIGDQYLTRLLRSSKNRSNSFMSAFRTIHAMVDRLWNACAHHHKHDKLRLEPVMVYIFGKPGVGKSLLMNTTITMVMNKIDAMEKRSVPFKLSKNLYVRNENEDHWNGFVPSEARVTVFDDAMQLRTEDSIANLVHDIIRMHNVTTYPLNMADLDSKGATPFMSSMVFFTSNIRPSRNLIATAANSPDAILRRFTVVIEQKIKPEYANEYGHLDIHKVRAQFPPRIVNIGGEEKMVWDQGSFDAVYTFDQYNQAGNVIKTLNFREYVALLIETYMVRRKWGQITLNTIEHVEQEAQAPEYGPENLQAEGWREWVRKKRVVEEIERTSPNTSEVWEDARDDLVPERCIIDVLGAAYVRAQLAGGATRQTLIEVYFNLKEYAQWRGSLLIEAHERHIAWREKIFAQMADGAVEFLAKMAEKPLVKVGLAILGGIAMVFGVRRLMGTSIEAVPTAEATFSGDPRTRKHVRKVKVESAIVGEATFSGDPRTRQHKRKLKAEEARRVEVKNIVLPIDEKIDESLDLYPTLCNGKLSKDHEYQVSVATDCPEDFYEMHAEASSDQNAIELGMSKLANACVDITARFECGDHIYSTSMKAMHIGGRLLIAPAHLLHGAPPGLQEGDITISRGDLNRRTFSFKELVFDTTYQVTKDVVVIVLPKRMPPSVDLTKSFHDEDSVGEFQLTEGFMFIPHAENGYILNYTKELRKREGRTAYSLVDKDGQKTGIATVVNGYEYVMPTSKGQCGSPMVWMNSRVQKGRILGFHVAGMSNFGVSNALTCQFIASLHKKHNTIVFVQPRLDVTQLSANGVVSADTGVNYCGCVDREFAVRSPVKSKIKESTLNGVFPVETKPAPLCPFKTEDGTWINPAGIAIAKMVAPPTLFPESVAELATRHFSHTICSMTSPYEPEILTIHQAVNGTKTEYIVPMNMHTSPGYPWILERALRKGAPAGKFTFVTELKKTESDVEYYLHDEVRFAVERRIECAKRGVVPFTLFVDQLKDERRPLAKAETGRTRLFNVGPWDLNLALRMYTSAFMAHVMSNHVYGEISVGLNVHSDEWGIVYKQFTNNGTKWVGGDYGNYDKTLSYQLLMKCCDVINDWYNDGAENRLIRETLFTTCFSAYHLVGRHVYRVEQGNPSGIALTAIINSMVNAIMFRIVFIINGGDITHYLDHVCVKFYGDDNIGTVSDVVASFMNMKTLESTLASFGVEYTTPSKKIVDSEFLAGDDITYLKRSFRLESGRVFAPLSMTSIREMIMWIRESMSDTEALIANWKAATMEMFHYGREEYEIFVNFVQSAARERKVKLPFVTFLVSGKYWGAEDKIDVILHGIQTDRDAMYCYLSGESMEESLQAQSKTCASENKGRSAPAPRIVEYRAVNTSTANPTTSETMPTLQDGAPTMEENVVTTRNELLTFADTSMVTNTLPQDVPPVPPMRLDPYEKETLVKYLQRTQYYNFVWSSADVSGTLVMRMHLPNALFANPQIWDKLKNFAYFRAGVKFGIRMNGSKFHYGSMLVSWSPGVGNTGTLNSATNNIYTAASNPSFVVSPSENEVHEFEMPYALPSPYIPLERFADSCYHLGCVSLHVLNPVTIIGTPTDVPFTLFMNFTDVDVAGYTSNVYTIPTVIMDTQLTFPALIPGAPVAGFGVDGPPLVAQGKIERKNKEAITKSTKGVVSGVAETIGSVAATLTVLPEIGVFAGAVSMAAKGIAAVASYLGYAFPNSLATSPPRRLYLHNLSTTHGVNEADVLGIDPENSVGSCCEMMGSKPHSMDILSIVQTPSLLRANFVWEPTYASGTSLLYGQVNPLSLVTRDLTHSYESFLSFTSRAFSYWRGSIRFHVSIVCSQMHVGRLQISWVPYSSLLPPPTALNTTTTVTRVIDIEKETEVDFSIPFLRETMWLACDNFEANTNIPCSNGWILLSVLNPINYPSSPVPPVYINMWVSAGADFQLARPDLALTRYPVYNTADYPTDTEELQAQGITREMIKDADAKPLMPGVGSLEVGHCMGEVISNIKELMLRPCQWSVRDFAAANGLYTAAILISPFNGVRNIDYTTTPNYIAYFQRIFRYSRGSFVVRAIPLSSPEFYSAGTECNVSTISHRPQTTGPLGQLTTVQRMAFTTGTPTPVSGNLFGTIRRANAAGSAISMSPLQPLAAVIPYYATQPFQFNFGNPNNPAQNNAYPVTRWGTVNSGYIDTAYGFIIMAHAADDFELGFLVGPPPIMYKIEPPP